MSDLVQPDPPAGLSAEAQTRWRAVIAELAARGARLDLELLQTYCQIWSRWREAEAAIAKTGALVKKPRGGVEANPLIAVSNQAGAQVRVLEQRLGLAREPAPRQAEPMSLRSYAKRRGVSVEAVSRAVAKGRLTESVTRVGGVPKISDPELADREWTANTDLSKAPGSVKERAASDSAPPAGDDGGCEAIASEDEAQVGPSIATASAREKHWKAKLAELTYQQRAGELVNAAEMAAEMANAYSTVRTKLLGVPSKAKQQLPHLTLADLATIDEIVREALEELASGEEHRPAGGFEPQRGALQGASFSAPDAPDRPTSSPASQPTDVDSVDE